MMPFLLPAFWSLLVSFVTRFLPFLSVTSIVGVITAALTNFFAKRGLSILAGLGLGLGVYTGLDTLIETSVTALQNVLTEAQGASSSSVPVVQTALKAMSYMGFFDAFSIVIAGYLTSSGIVISKAYFKMLTN